VAEQLLALGQQASVLNHPESSPRWTDSTSAMSSLPTWAENSLIAVAVSSSTSSPKKRSTTPRRRFGPSGSHTSTERFGGPGSTLIARFGQSRWNWARRTPPSNPSGYGSVSPGRGSGPR